MPQVYRIELECTQPGQVTGCGGEEAHGLLFAHWYRENPEQAERHHAAPDKPFSLRLDLPAERATLTQGERAALIIGALTPEAATLAESLGAHPGPIGLGTARARIRGHERRWPANGPTWADLPELGPQGPLTFDFRTPTSFRRQGTQVPLPDPELVFGNLLQRWNAFSPSPLPETWREEFRLLRIAQMDVHTASVPYRNYSIVGFVGHVTYLPPNNASPFLRQGLAALAALSEISGVGYKTSMGLGAVRVRQPSRTLPSTAKR